LRQIGAEVDGSRGLADSTFLIGKRVDTGQE
jgi:hypothetical protein